MSYRLNNCMLIFDMATKKQIEFAEKINAIPSKPFTCYPTRGTTNAENLDFRIEITAPLFDENQARHLEKRLRGVIKLEFEVAGRNESGTIRQVVYYIPTPDYGHARLAKLEQSILDKLGSINQFIAEATAGAPIVTRDYPITPEEYKAKKPSIEPREKQTSKTSTPKDYRNRGDLPPGLEEGSRGR